MKTLMFKGTDDNALNCVDFGGQGRPVLLIHGDDDRNVEFSQTVDLLQRLRVQKVHVEELIYPDEIHDFLMWKSWIKAYTATEEFFGRQLGK